MISARTSPKESSQVTSVESRRATPVVEGAAVASAAVAVGVDACGDGDDECGIGDGSLIDGDVDTCATPVPVSAGRPVASRTAPLGRSPNRPPAAPTATAPTSDAIAKAAALRRSISANARDRTGALFIAGTAVARLAHAAHRSASLAPQHSAHSNSQHLGHVRNGRRPGPVTLWAAPQVSQ
jgi:hypothetical protein